MIRLLIYINGKLPGFYIDAAILSYARPPPECPQPNMSNVAAKVLILFSCPQLTIGMLLRLQAIILEWSVCSIQPQMKLGAVHEVTVGNVTKTTLIGKQQDSLYRVSVSGL